MWQTLIYNHFFLFSHVFLFYNFGLSEKTFAIGCRAFLFLTHFVSIEYVNIPFLTFFIRQGVSRVLLLLRTPWPKPRPRWRSKFCSLADSPPPWGTQSESKGFPTYSISQEEAFPDRRRKILDLSICLSCRFDNLSLVFFFWGGSLFGPRPIRIRILMPSPYSFLLELATTDRIAGALHTGAHLSSLRHCLRGRPTLFSTKGEPTFLPLGM